ncbi:MAG: hypothetical protein JXR12_06515 [Neptunomonas phycophila]|uniref:hypothetical protein n=1 Tax=Neptunomonas phycophila TaxID=1572645 RepID=UPI003B8DC165
MLQDKLSDVMIRRDKSTAKMAVKRLLREINNGTDQASESHSGLHSELGMAMRQIKKSNSHKHLTTLENILSSTFNALRIGEPETYKMLRLGKFTGSFAMTCPGIKALDDESIQINHLACLVTRTMKTTVGTCDRVTFSFHALHKFIRRAKDNSFDSLFNCIQQASKIGQIITFHEHNEGNIIIPCNQGIFFGVRSIGDLTDTAADAATIQSNITITTFVSFDMLYDNQTYQASTILHNITNRIDEFDGMFKFALLKNFNKHVNAHRENIRAKGVTDVTVEQLGPLICSGIHRSVQEIANVEYDDVVSNLQTQSDYKSVAQYLDKIQELGELED